MKDINHKFELGDIVYAILDTKLSIKIEKYIITGITIVPRFGFPMENSKGLIKNRNTIYTLYPLVEHIIPSTTDNSIARPMTTTQYSINPLDKSICLDADRVYGSIDDLLTELKETAK